MPKDCVNPLKKNVLRLLENSCSSNPRVGSSRDLKTERRHLANHSSDSEERVKERGSSQRSVACRNSVAYEPVEGPRGMRSKEKRQLGENDGTQTRGGPALKMDALHVAGNGNFPVRGSRAEFPWAISGTVHRHAEWIRKL